MSKMDSGRMTRRGLLSLTVTANGAALMPLAQAQAQAQVPTQHPPGSAPSPAPLTLTINGQTWPLDCRPEVTLADALRERVGLTGTKVGCNHGQCGACTVHIDGRRALACLTLAATCEGKAITTIEGAAAADGTLHPMQQAFIDHDALQCGYCTPGQIMSAIALVREGRLGSDDDIREYMSGNLCRCAAYPHIVAAIRDGARAMGA
ncbi:MAG: (2Fe-2S)-binding protein [Burkholderiaceae bacterium]